MKLQQTRFLDPAILNKQELTLLARVKKGELTTEPVSDNRRTYMMLINGYDILDIVSQLECDGWLIKGDTHYTINPQAPDFEFNDD